MNSNYTRVIPRDLFNEAKLLKCVGRLSLLVLDRMAPKGLTIDETGEPFRVVMLQEGALTIINYPISVHGIPHTFATPVNNRSNYPLDMQVGESDDYFTIRVFDESGNFEPEFLDYMKTSHKRKATERRGANNGK